MRSLHFFRQFLQRFLFGFDFFIAHRSADGSHFARTIFDALEKRGFDCFLDVKHYEASGSLSQMQSLALRRTTRLLVIVSPKAHSAPQAGKDYLLDEILEFKRINRGRGKTPIIVPIGTADTLSPISHPESALLGEIPTPANGHICIFDSEAAKDGEVQKATLDKIENDFTEGRRRRVRQRITALAAVMLVTALGLVGFYGYRAWDERQIGVSRSVSAEASAMLEQFDEIGALRKAMVAMKVRETAEARSILWNSHQRLPHLSKVIPDSRGEVSDLVFNPDGKEFVVLCSQEYLEVRSSEDGRLLRQLGGEIGRDNRMAYSADGARLAICGLDGKIEIRDSKSLTLIRTLLVGPGPLDSDNLWSMAWTSHDRYLLAGDAGGGVTLWDLAAAHPETPQWRRQVLDSTRLIDNLSVSADGTLAVPVASSHRGKLMLVSLPDGQVRELPLGWNGNLASAGFTAVPGQLLVLIDGKTEEDKKKGLRLYDIRSNATLWEKAIKLGYGSSPRIAKGADDEHFCVISHTGNHRCFSLKTGEVEETTDSYLSANQRSAATADMRTWVSASRDGLMLWHWNANALLTSHGRVSGNWPLNTDSMARDGHVFLGVATLSEEQEDDLPVICNLDQPGDAVLTKFVPNPENEDRASAATISRDGQRAAYHVSGNSERIEEWTLRPEALLHLYPLPEKPQVEQMGPGPGSGTLLVLFEDRPLEYWHADGRHEAVGWKGVERFIPGEGNSVFCGLPNGQVFHVDLATKQVLWASHIPEKSDHYPSEMAVSKDGRLLAICDRSLLSLYDVKSGKRRKEIHVDGLSTQQISFSPDDRRLAVGCDDGIVRILDVPSLELHARLDLDVVGAVGFTAFDAAGRLVTDRSTDTVSSYEMDFHELMRRGEEIFRLPQEGPSE